MRRLLAFLLTAAILMFTGCDLMDYIPDYKFSPDLPLDLIAGSYWHDDADHEGFSSSTLALNRDGTYVLQGEDSDEYQLFPDRQGTYAVTVESYSIYRAGGTIVFKPRTPVIGTAGESVSARFSWTSTDRADADIPLSLTLSFPSGAVVVYNGVFI